MTEDIINLYKLVKQFNNESVRISVLAKGDERLQKLHKSEFSKNYGLCFEYLFEILVKSTEISIKYNKIGDANINIKLLENSILSIEANRLRYSYINDEELARRKLVVNQLKEKINCLNDTPLKNLIL